MNKLKLEDEIASQSRIQRLCAEAERRLSTNPLQRCPVELLRAYLGIALAQSCGKCTPCRIGLRQLELLLDELLDGRGSARTISLLKSTALAVAAASDCATGYNAADTVLNTLKDFSEDFESHLTSGVCRVESDRRLPCVSRCPAHVDIPGYIALVGAGRCEDAVRLIRKDNPFVSVCGYVCEHPCESHCRRRMIDESINIRAVKRYAADNAPDAMPQPTMDDTGKRVAVLGGGPCGLTAAYYLSIMGHKVTVLEQRAKLGGMLRYGIPSYRLPRELLDRELEHILSTGVEARTTCGPVDMDALRSEYDAVCIAVGAHTHKRLNIPGEDGEGVISALQLLRGIGDDSFPLFKEKRVVVIGGGNVAMDVARTAKRLGATRVTVVYRRRKADMTALPEEIEGAIAEGCEVLMLHAPKEIELDGEGRVSALISQPQIVGKPDSKGRPCPVNAPEPARRLPCDVVVIAAGQGIELEPLVKFGVPVANGTVAAAPWTGFEGLPGVFSGGDCVSGPATVVRAVAAGKVLAANIDHYLGYSHEITADVDIPAPRLVDKPALGRVDTREREASERQGDFQLMEYCMTDAEARQECSRCLRCDHFGYGAFRGGRNIKW